MLEISKTLGNGLGVYSQVTDASGGNNIKMGVYYPTSYHGEPGIWFNQASPTDSNYAFLGNGVNTYFNVVSTGAMFYG